MRWKFQEKIIYILPILLFICYQSDIKNNSTSSNPVLKLEPGMHTDKIWKISVDAKEKFLVSASEDNSVRVWEIDSVGKLKLDKVIFPPEPEKEKRDPREQELGKKLPLLVEGDDLGKLHSIAISPDGTLIAAGNDATTLYIFDRITGKTIQIIRKKELRPYNIKYSTIVEQLKFSPDNQFLAVSMGENDGLSVFQKKTNNTFARIGTDWEYKNTSRSSDFFFQNTGQESIKALATTAKDGYVRLYSLKNNELSIPVKIMLNGKPHSVQFSQDGKELAVGYSDSTKIDIFSVKINQEKITLDFSYSPVMDDFLGNNLMVCYSGDNLYAATSSSISTKIGSTAETINYIRKWENRGKGKYIDIPAGKDGVWDCKPSKDGGIFYAATGDFGIGKIGSDGKRDYLLLPPLGDTKSIGENLLVSNDGSRIQFDIEKDSSFIFDIYKKELASTKETDSTLLAPILQAEGIDLKNWENHFSPSLNGKRLSLDTNEISQKIVINPNNKEFLLRSNTSLRYYNKDGQLIWKKPIINPIYGMNISGNGQLILLTLEDATIRWYRVSDGQELLTFFPLNKKEEKEKKWIIWTAKPYEGYYDTVIGGEELLGWHFNQGSTKTTNFFPVSSFRKDYYRPDVIKEIFSLIDVNKSIDAANQKYSITEKAVDISNSEPPSVNISTEKYYSDESIIDIQLSFTNSPSQIKRITTIVNGAKNSRIFKANEKLPEAITIELTNKGENKIQFVVENEKSTSESNKITVFFKGEKSEKKPNLYLFAVGISKYKSQKITTLTYADKDARDFINLMKNQKGKSFENVIVDNLILNENATHADILKQLQLFHVKPTDKDVTMIFFSGHGGSDGSFYYLLPNDFDSENKAATGIESSYLVKLLSSIKGKSILIIDACYAGSIGKDMTLLGNLSNEKRIVLLSSSNNAETSQESSQWENGALTYAIKKGIKEGKATDPNTNIVNLRYLRVWLESNVEFLTNKKQKPTILIPDELQDFEIAVPDKK